MKETTHFGFQEIPAEEKSGRVAEVFRSVAPNYDLKNDLMSLGLHRLWKRFTITVAAVRPGQRVLDLAAGTGDLAKSLAQRVGDTGEVILADINAAMLERGRAKLLDCGLHRNVRYVQADAEALPFPDDYFDCITMAFGLRNVTHKARALSAMHRVLKPGGQALILEFSHLTLPRLQHLYDAYSFSVLPWLGEWFAEDADSYRYLAESIRRHPDQAALKQMMLDAGFEDCDYHNLSAGIVALHRGYKY